MKNEIPRTSVLISCEGLAKLNKLPIIDTTKSAKKNLPKKQRKSSERLNNFSLPDENTIKKNNITKQDNYSYIKVLKEKKANA